MGIVKLDKKETKKLERWQKIAEADGFVSANIHSPVCGTIVEVVKRKTAQGRMADFVHIKSNGEQKVVTLEPLTNPTKEQIICYKMKKR